MELLIVGIIVGGAIFFTLRSFVNMYKGDSGCACSGGCACSDSGTCVGGGAKDQCNGTPFVNGE